MPEPPINECDITQQALSCGLAETALKHYNHSMPWGAKTRLPSQYLYVLHVNSKGRATLWMRDIDHPTESMMYFSFNEKIGALQSNDADRSHLSMLSDAELNCINQARLQILENRLKSSSSL